MRLLNVRLADEDVQLVRKLRDRGVSISDLVRTAIREEARALPSRAPLDTDAVLAEIRERFPAPRDAAAAPKVDTTQRREVQEFIRAKLRRKR